MGEGIERILNIRATFRAAFPVYDTFDWEMPSDDDTDFIEKLEQGPLWGNKFREDDVDTIINTLQKIGFDVPAVATRLRGLYESAGRPKVQKDMQDNQAAESWAHLITDLLHVVTTQLYKEKPDTLGTARMLMSTMTLTPEERMRPLEQRHNFQNNIAIMILTKPENFPELVSAAEKVNELFIKRDKTHSEKVELLDVKLMLEKNYFKERFPEFFSADA